MKDYIDVLLRSPLFAGVEPGDLTAMLGCLSARRSSFPKNSFILRRGELCSSMGMVLSGSVHIIKEDFWGNQTILGRAAPGQLFGESFACLPAEPLGVSVVAAENADVLFLELGKILTVCSSACGHHNRLLRSLYAVMAGKNLELTKKLEHVSRRTIREKLLSYLSAESQRAASAAFMIPFNRQQLADYLSVDRSALSSELGKLRDEGILSFRKNSFTLNGQSE